MPMPSIWNWPKTRVPRLGHDQAQSLMLDCQFHRQFTTPFAIEVDLAVRGVELSASEGVGGVPMQMSSPPACCLLAFIAGSMSLTIAWTWLISNAVP